jgi:predicted metal-binding protein
VQKNKLGLSRKIALETPDDVLERDLINFKNQTFDLGATMAEIIDAAWVDVDERVPLKCAIPMCPYYNKNLSCPPNGPSLDLVRKAFSRYSKAILFAFDVIPPEEFSDRSLEREAVKSWARKSMETAARLETIAMGNGYYFAMGLSQVSCMKALCGLPKCLVLDGDKCPYPLQSRPSMESMGIDVYRLVTKVGWDIYPIYRSVDPKAVPRALSVGIVFIC